MMQYGSRCGKLLRFMACMVALWMAALCVPALRVLAAQPADPPAPSGVSVSVDYLDSQSGKYKVTFLPSGKPASVEAGYIYAYARPQVLSGGDWADASGDYPGGTAFTMYLAPGSYQVRARIDLCVDGTQECLSSSSYFTKSFTVSGLPAPAEPTGLTVTLDYGDKQGKFTDSCKVKAEMSAAGPVGATLEWENGTGYYAPGTHTAKVRSKQNGQYSEWVSKTFQVVNSAPSKPSGLSASVDYSDIRNPYTSDAKVRVSVDASASDPDEAARHDEVRLDYESGGETGYYGIGSHTVRVRAMDTFGQYSDWASVSVDISDCVPSISSITASVDYNDAQNRFTTSCRVKADVAITVSDPDEWDAVRLEYAPGRENLSGYYGLGDYTVRVRAVDKLGQASDWAERTFAVNPQAMALALSSPTLGNAASISGTSATVTMQADTSCGLPVHIDMADYYGTGGILFSKDLAAGSQSAQFSKAYGGGRHMVVVKGTGMFGEVKFASRMFVVGSSVNMGGGRVSSSTTTLTENGMYQDGKPLAYISSFHVTNPRVPSHSSGSDSFSVKGMTASGTWETVVSGSCAFNGQWSADSKSGSWTSAAGSGKFSYPTNKYVKLQFQYYTNHVSCARSAGTTMSYSVEFAFMPGTLNEDMWDDIVSTSKYDVVTTCEGEGWIDPSVYRAPGGRSVTVNYGVNGPDSYLKKLSVDGKEVSGPALLPYLGSYSFVNLNANHKIHAVFAKVPKLTVTDSLPGGVPAKGDGVSEVRITGTDYLGRPVTLYRELALPGDGSTGSITFAVPAGTYQVERMDGGWAGVETLSGSPISLVDALEGTVQCGSSMSSYRKWTGAKCSVNEFKVPPVAETEDEVP